jgi:hypothetical protein
VLYTGGTIGMVRNLDGVLVPHAHLENKIRTLNILHDEVKVNRIPEKNLKIQSFCRSLGYSKVSLYFVFCFASLKSVKVLGKSENDQNVALVLLNF